MAQGKSKLKGKAKKPAMKIKQPKAMKAKAARKGARAVTPKKEKLKQEAKMKKGLETAINKKIEVELKDRAVKEGKPFKMLATKVTKKPVAAAAGKKKKK